jgi:hypothetical protein
MGFEGFNESPEPTIEKLPTVFQVKMALQRSLIERSIKRARPGENIDLYPLEWIKKYAAQVSDIFKQVVDERPNLVQEWVSDPDSVLDLVEGRIEEPKEEESLSEAA